MPATAAKTTATTKTTTAATTTVATTMRLGPWWLGLVLLLLALQLETSECRYLPTRSHGDDLDKLRELMLQILESSNEERPPNEAGGVGGGVGGGGSGGSGGNALLQHAAWKLKPMEPVDPPRKYGGRGGYEAGHYYY